MSQSPQRIDPEIVVGAAVLLLSTLGLIFIGVLIAPPKILFGRSLTAIPPTLFPALVLGGLAILSAILLVQRVRRPDGIRIPRAEQNSGRRRAVWLFAIMTVYALTMGPVGFLISSAVSMAVIAFLVGNRSLVQIGLVSALSPVILYLVATRLLAVSLPELSAIEFAYARLLGEFGSTAAPALQSAQ